MAKDADDLLNIIVAPLVKIIEKSGGTKKRGKKEKRRKWEKRA